MKVDIDFLNKQVDKITNKDELCSLFFSIKKMKNQEQLKMIEIRKQYEMNDFKLDLLMIKIDNLILNNKSNIILEDTEIETDEESDEEEDININDSILLSEDSE